MPIRAAGLALPVVIGIGVAVTSCGSAPGTARPAVAATRSGAAATGSPAASPVAPSPAGSVPPGYKRVGGAAQGISLAAPVTWVAHDLTKESPESVASKAAPGGSSAATLVQQLETLQKLHAIVVYDGESAALDGGPLHFVPNFDAACGPSGTADVGAAGVPLVKAELVAKLKRINATHITVKYLKIGGVPGVEVSSQFRPAGDYRTLHGTEFAVLPKPHKGCDVTATAGQGESLASVVNVVAATAQFP